MSTQVIYTTRKPQPQPTHAPTKAPATAPDRITLGWGNSRLTLPQKSGQVS